MLDLMHEFPSISRNQMRNAIGSLVPAQARLIPMAMSPEEKLWLCVALQAVAENDEIYIHSAEFDRICGFASVDPEVLRGATPQQARQGLEAIRRDWVPETEELEEAV